MGGWIAANWFTVLSAIGIVGSLLFTAVSVRSETKTRRISNLLSLTQSHRELWSEVFHRPDLKRVVDASVDLKKQSLTSDEFIYVKLVILHLSSAYQAMKTGLVIKPKGLREDIGMFFSLPIPRVVWKKLKVLQNDDFVNFVDQCLALEGDR